MKRGAAKLSQNRSIIIELETATPTLIGWYKPNLRDPLGLRPTEIKGIWRWWARALVGGLLYDRGEISGQTGDKEVKKPIKDEVNKVSNIVGKDLGLGTTSSASCFKLFLETINLNLLKLGSRIQKEVIGPGSSFRLHIEIDERESCKKIMHGVALKILLVALQLSGVGKGSRKGLGSLDIKGVNGLGAKRDIGELIRDIREELCRHVGTSGSCGGSEKNWLPPFPVLSESSFRWGSNKVSVTTIWRISCESRVYQEIRDLSAELIQYSWLMGLPRSTLSMYCPEGYASRRASSIILAHHGRGNMFGDGDFVTVMLSADWPKGIFCNRGGEQEKAKKIEEKIADAHYTFISEFKKRIEKCRLDILWPKLGVSSTG